METHKQGKSVGREPAGGAADAEDSFRLSRKLPAIVALSLGTVLTTVDGNIVNVALPTLARDLHVQPSSAVLIVTVYQLMLMMCVLPFSALGDRIGHRSTYQLGQTIFVVATLLCFFARSLPFLVLLRGFQALGAAAALSMAPALIRAVYPRKQLGRGLSFNTVVATSASSLAPTLGGAILAFAPWPWLFAAVVPFGLLSILCGRKSLPQAKHRSDNYDILGAVLCAGMFGLTVAGLQSAVGGDSPVVSAALVVLGVGIGVFFVRRELRQERPMLPVDLMENRAILLPCIGSLAGFFGVMLMVVSLPFRMQMQFHFSPALTGAMMAPLPLTGLVVAPVAGYLSDRIPAGFLGGIGMTITAAGLASLAFLPAHPGYVDIMWRVAVIGFGANMFFSPNSRQIIGAAPVSRTAAAGALVSTLRGAGQTLASTAAAALLALGLGTGAVPSLVGAGFAVLAAVCSLVALGAHLRRTRPEELVEI